MKSGLRDAPPTKEPSISEQAARSRQLAALTLPPYKIRKSSATSAKNERSVSRLNRCVVGSLGKNLTRDVVFDPFPESGVHFLGLFRRGRFARSDCPDWLVGQDDPVPVLGVLDVVGDGFKLLEADLLGLSGFPLLQLFSDTRDDLQAVFQGKGDLEKANQ